MILGITGGIATGKSTVSAMFKELGAFLLDADKIAREVVEPGTEGSKQIYQYFGNKVFLDNGRLNRPLLGKIIFQDERQRRKLNKILHPLILEQLCKRTDVIFRNNKKTIVLWDVALLIEEHMTIFVDKVLVVCASKMIQLNRLMKRNHISEEEALQRVGAQMDIEEKKRQAHFVVDNSDSLRNTKEQVDQIWVYLSKNE
jgi:dephospho-CoA kinase